MTDAEDSLSFERDIRPLFNDEDRESMEFAFDLWSHSDVAENAQAILERVEDGSMPCYGPWSEDRISLFRHWVEAGTPI